MIDGGILVGENVNVLLKHIAGWSRLHSSAILGEGYLFYTIYLVGGGELKMTIGFYDQWDKKAGESEYKKINDELWKYFRKNMRGE